MHIPDLSLRHGPHTGGFFAPLRIDRLLRDFAHALDGPRTRVALAPGELAAAEELVRRRYAWRGYKTALPEERDCAGPRAGDHWVTLLVEAAGSLIGTLTVGPESPRGLLAEGTYGGEIRALRRKGHRIGEVTKLALEKGVEWKAALDALVQAAWAVTRIAHGLTDVVIEVNPRHSKFYQRELGFEQLASGRVCPRVGAPSVLLVLDLERFGRRWARASVA